LKVLILVPGPENTLPSQRFRVEQYLNNVQRTKVQFVLSSFYFLWVWKVLYKKGHFAKKVAGICLGFIKRFLTLFTLSQYDFIYIHREAAPVGPPVFEWIIAKIWRKPIIYDFDDAIWVDASSAVNPMAARVKCAWKVKHICKWSYIITVGNSYLADFARQFNEDVRIIPTVVNTENRHKYLQQPHDGIQTIGWTGTFTNFDQFELIEDAIIKLQERHKFRLQIIADKDPGFKNFAYEFLPWREESEIADLMQFDIGIMPLRDSTIQLGKCAFKAIQYMSLGIPAVVSPVGANCQVVENGNTGVWASTTEEWYQHLETLLLNKQVRSEMGKAARGRVIHKYSVVATQNNFTQLFAVPAPSFVFRPALLSGRLNFLWPFTRYRQALTH
jgi:glycosyltransferase involved in cell wall biosynthesis